MTVMPSSENERYKLFDKSEYKEIVALINSSNGKYEPSPEPIAGGGTMLYITASDGTIHTVVNNGNTYLCIDGDSYTASYKYLSSWDKYGLNTVSYTHLWKALLVYFIKAVPYFSVPTRTTFLIIK